MLLGVRRPAQHRCQHALDFNKQSLYMWRLVSSGESIADTLTEIFHILGVPMPLLAPKYTLLAVGKYFLNKIKPDTSSFSEQ